MKVLKISFNFLALLMNLKILVILMALIMVVEPPIETLDRLVKKTVLIEVITIMKSKTFQFSLK